MKKLSHLFFLILTIVVAGCSSEPKGFMLSDTNDISTADGEAFTASSMGFRKKMPTHEREEPNNWEFYFKHCSINGNESYFSKTSYDCSGPYY